jgi:hypothetical protein
VGIAERFPSLALFGDGRKWHFGKHVNSLTGLWGPSYWPQFGMSKCHLRLAQYGDSLPIAANSTARSANSLRHSALGPDGQFRGQGEIATIRRATLRSFGWWLVRPPQSRPVFPPKLPAGYSGSFCRVLMGNTR